MTHRAHHDKLGGMLQVHRGVYEAAKLLYERYKPMVEEHLATSPFAKVSFTGHSLGGSLGSLLMLMFLHRGVIPISAISPSYTFGAPAIFCEASGPGGTCALAASTTPKALPAGGQPSAAGVVSPAAVPKVDLPQCYNDLRHLHHLLIVNDALNICGRASALFSSVVSHAGGCSILSSEQNSQCSHGPSRGGRQESAGASGAAHRSNQEHHHAP